MEMSAARCGYTELQEGDLGGDGAVLFCVCGGGYINLHMG